MRKGYLLGSVVLFVRSILCIVATAVEVALGRYTMDSLQFIGAVVFHPITAITASFLLVKARPRSPGIGKEGAL